MSIEAHGRPVRHDGAHDDVHQKLRQIIEKPETAYLWSPDDAITFTPRLLQIYYGDGRALFTFATINQRPAYWVIRACSSWYCGGDHDDLGGPSIAEMSDIILTDLEEAFGSGRCGYSGNNLFWPREERQGDCLCEDCTDEFVAKWPMVDGAGGCSWSRMQWPAEFVDVPETREDVFHFLAP